MYNDLTPCWQEAFNEAWNAFCNGTIPIGAIIADKDGNILSRGRNAIFSSDALNPRILHAEMNCMMNLDIKKYPNVKEYYLYTTMEPCPMCMGTIIMDNLRHIRYGAHDDYCGAVRMLYRDSYMSSKNADILFDDNGLEAVQLTIQTVFEFMRYCPQGNERKIYSNKVIDQLKKRCPESFTAAAKLFLEGYLDKCIENSTPANEIYDNVSELCASIREKNKNMLFTARIEQTKDYPKRMKYIPETDSFIEKDCTSLSADRCVPEPYGWILESGNPPRPHLDVLVMTDKEYKLGDRENVRVIGVFCRNDKDHKLVSVPIEREIYDFSELTDIEKDDMHRLYPIAFPGEGWFGVEKAREIINEYFSLRKKKNIILVQHCESEHHLNGMIGAWTDWNLTERGREQARITGEWLLENEFSVFKKPSGNTASSDANVENTAANGPKSYFLSNTKLYCSTLKRAKQTAEEIMKTLDVPITYSENIREVNAGSANGKSCQWNRENSAPYPDHYDADYRPFPDADSDRDLWNRVYPFYQQILNDEAENIIVVSHGCTLSFLQCMLMGHGDVNCRAIFAPHGPSGSLSKFYRDNSGRMNLAYLNRRVF